MKIEKKEYLSTGCRLLTNTYEEHELLLHHLKKENKVRIFREGQNFWSKDRDLFAFYIAICKAWGGSPETIRDLNKEDHKYIEDTIELLCNPPKKKPVKISSPIIKKKTEIKKDSTARSSKKNAASMPNVSLSDLRETLMQVIDKKVNSVLSLIVTNQEKLTDRIDEVKTDALKRMDQLQKKEDIDVLGELQKESDKKLEDTRTNFQQQINEMNRLYTEKEEEAKELQKRLLWYEKEEEQENLDVQNSLATMERVVHLFKDISQKDPIVVHENAVKSAKRCSSKKRGEVLNLLLTLRELAYIKYIQGNNSVGNNLKQWFEPRKYEYAIRDSKSTTGKYGDERTIMYNKQPVLMEHHVTLFPGQTGDCVQVYFYFDDKGRKIVIGYCGEHLRISSRAN